MHDGFSCNQSLRIIDAWHVLDKYTLLLYFSLVCVPYFLVDGVCFLQQRGLNVAYVLELLSPAAVGVAGAATSPLATLGVAAASRVRYFPDFWGGKGSTRVVYRTPRDIL